MTHPPDAGPEPEPGSPSIEPERRGLAGLIMRLMRRFTPEHAEDAERESREWFVVCTKCDTARTWAELGGIRYGAYSKGKRMLMTCPTCARRRWHKVERRPSTASE
jgi:hypothetical protein